MIAPQTGRIIVADNRYYKPYLKYFMKKLDSQNLEIVHKYQNFRVVLLPLVVSAVILGIVGISYIRSNPDSLFPVAKPEISKKNATKWYNAVVNGNEKDAILYAATIIPDDVPVLPNPDFIQLLSNNSFGTLIITSPFNHFDYLRWKDAYEIRRIVRSYEEHDEPLPEIFKDVLTKKKKVSDREGQFKDKPYTSIIDIWKDGYTSLDEWMRLFSAISYQSGYEVQVVSFYDETWKLQHMVCEIRKKGKSYLADFIHGRIWNDITVAQLAVNSNPVKTVWPENVLSSINRRVYRLPAEAMDFKLYNMQLSDKLTELGLVDRPRFGKNPQVRIDKYIEKYSNKSEKSPYLYWNFPFISLKSSPYFPKEWRLPDKSGGEGEK